LKFTANADEVNQFLMCCATRCRDADSYSDAAIQLNFSQKCSIQILGMTRTTTAAAAAADSSESAAPNCGLPPIGAAASEGAANGPGGDEEQRQHRRQIIWHCSEF